jgi:HAD superfamily hydrolase (TIGR01459 family)
METLECSEPKPIKGVGEIVDQYDLLLLDQWGVIHDGRNLYAHVKETLKFLRARSKSVAILTNSSKSNETNETRLAERFGITKDHFDHLVSAAEYMREVIAGRQIGHWSRPGKNVFFVAEPVDNNFLDETDLTIVDNVGIADFVLLLSIAPTDQLDNHHEWMRSAADHQLTVVSPSSDVYSVSARGLVGGMANIIRTYEQLGGRCLNFGKPAPFVYESVIQTAYHSIAPSRVLAIGDQLQSDVAGAQRFGFHTALVLTGAGAACVGTSDPLEAVERLVSGESNGCRPNYVLEELC